MRPRCKQRRNVWPTAVSLYPVNPKVLQVAPETPRMVGDRPLTEVAVGILQASDQRVLLTTRPVGKAYAGYWEFPGGKLEAGETVLDALARELHEEINVQIDGGEVLQSDVVDYPHALVRLHFCLVRSWRGVIMMREAQVHAWTALPTELTPILPGTVPVLAWLPGRLAGARVV
jgi:8-oxo-dGTP diphosphatase